MDTVQFEYRIYPYVDYLQCKTVYPRQAAPPYSHEDEERSHDEPRQEARFKRRTGDDVSSAVWARHALGIWAQARCGHQNRGLCNYNGLRGVAALLLGWRILPRWWRILPLWWWMLSLGRVRLLGWRVLCALSVHWRFLIHCFVLLLYNIELCTTIAAIVRQQGHRGYIAPPQEKSRMFRKYFT